MTFSDKYASKSNSMFSRAQVVEIRRRAKTEKQVDLAEEFGCSPNLIGDIIHYITYRWVD